MFILWETHYTNTKRPWTLLILISWDYHKFQGRSTFKTSFYKAQQKKKKHFWALSVVWGVYIFYNIHIKSTFVVILRSQPSIYNRCLTIYGKSCKFIIIRPLKYEKNIFLGNFRLSKGYACLRPPIVSQVLHSSPGVN